MEPNPSEMRADDLALRQFVTLDQAAALVGRSKSCLYKYLFDPAKLRKYKMPDPTIEGGGGQPHEWDWEVIRPWLETVFRRTLPRHLPFSRLGY